MFHFDKDGRPKIMTTEDMLAGIIPNYKEIMDLNSKNFMPQVPNPHELIGHSREAPASGKDGIKIVGEKEKVKKKPYKHSCPPMSEEAEKKAMMQTKEDLEKKLKEKEADLERWDKKAKDDVKKWFGSSDEISRQMLLDRTKKMQKILSNYTADNFKPAEASQKSPGLFAYVYPNDDKTIYLGDGFCDAPKTGRDSKMGILAHEMSHFDSISSTDDFKYGDEAIDLAINPIDGKPAIYNADSYEYYIEN